MNSLKQPSEPAITNQKDLDTRMRIEIKDIGIPPRPQILVAIEQEMRKDEPDFIRMSDLISSDVALAAGLIKTANSPFFGFSKRVRTVKEALVVLGLRTVTRSIAGLALQKIFPHTPSLERFWDASAKTALVAAWLAGKFRLPASVRPSDAYTFALFRDCGIPVLLIPFPEYTKVLQQANASSDREFTEIEDECLGVNHADVGAGLAEGWLLPPEMCEAISHHHSVTHMIGEASDALTTSARIMIALAQTAEYLLGASSGLNQTCEWGKLGSACLSTLGISEDELADLLDEFRQDERLTGSGAGM